MTLHASSSNRGNKRRHSFIARYAVDGAVYTPRGPGEYPQFPDCGLSAGMTLDGPQFPLVELKPRVEKSFTEMTCRNYRPTARGSHPRVQSRTP